jgi:hypothetical protein
MTPAVVLAAAGKAGLLVLDGATLSALGRLPTVDPATDVAAAGAVAYVAAGESGWLIVDVSNPSAPSLKSSLPGAGPVRHLALAGTRVHVTDVSDTMRSIDVSKPLTPVERARLGPLVQVLRATGTGPYVFASEDAAGMSIFDAAPGDHDVDGMPDSWEQKIVDADPNDDIRTVADVQPGADFDGDGLSNLGEYLAGTDPTDANSVFAVSSAAQSAGTQFVVQWHSVTDKFYTLYRSTNLREGFHVLKPDIRADPPLNTYTDTLTSAESAFYVVATQ